MNLSSASSRSRRVGGAGVRRGRGREGRVEMSQLDGSAECDTGCVISYCQFLNASRYVLKLQITLEVLGGMWRGNANAPVQEATHLFAILFGGL